MFGVFYFDELYGFGRLFGIGYNIGRLSETVPAVNFTHNVTACPGMFIVYFHAPCSRRADTFDCVGYRVDSVRHTLSGLAASLSLAGPECNAFGRDIHQLLLSVTHETESRLHVHIYDKLERQFQIPESTLKSLGGVVATTESDLDVRHFPVGTFQLS